MASWRPILFSGPMVRALLDGRKTQTRRVVMPQPHEGCGRIFFGHYHPTVIDSDGEMQPGPMIFGVWDEDGEWGVRCPYGEPGDRLWVREECWIWGRWTRNGLTKTGRQKWMFRPEGRRVIFEKPATLAKRAAKPGHDGMAGWSYRHARYMPRWASRITLAVTSIRVERLQGITEEDAIAEGIPTDGAGAALNWNPAHDFRDLWQSINGARPGCSWDANPWVWVVGFERVREVPA